MAKSKLIVFLTPIMAMVFIAVICVGIFLSRRNIDSDSIVSDQKGELQKPIPSEEPRDTNKKRPRKLRSYEQRQKLIKAIELARNHHTNCRSAFQSVQ